MPGRHLLHFFPPPGGPVPTDADLDASYGAGRWTRCWKYGRDAIEVAFDCPPGEFWLSLSPGGRPRLLDGPQDLLDAQAWEDELEEERERSGSVPLTKKGAKIKRAMTKTYGKKKGARVFYASTNAGTISRR